MAGVRSLGPETPESAIPGAPRRPTLAGMIRKRVPAGAGSYDLEIHVDCQALRDFFGMVRGGAEGWDGSEPLRPVPS